LIRGVISLIGFGFTEVVRQLIKAVVDRMIGSGKVVNLIAWPELNTK
jgi:hypothetical protein